MPGWRFLVISRTVYFAKILLWETAKFHIFIQFTCKCQSCLGGKILDPTKVNCAVPPSTGPKSQHTIDYSIGSIYTKTFWPAVQPRGPANSRFNTLFLLRTIGSTFKLLLTIIQTTWCYGIMRKKLRLSMNWCCHLRFPLPSQKRTKNHSIHC